MKSLFAAVLFFFVTTAQARVVRYELSIKNQPVNLSGKKTVDFALAINGTIPGPTLEFTEGDEAEITVKNDLTNSDEDVSTHWHGILLPPMEDGVPFINTPPIYPGHSRVFKFPIRQNGTYWYHSHTMLQEQKGVFGAIVIHPKKETIKVDKEAVVVLGDWSDENPDQVLKNLKKDGDYYLYKKGTIRNYADAIGQGKLTNQFKNEWTRMGGMDLSDVGYDAFLINGKSDSQLVSAKAGEKIRLRIINASSSTYFHVSLGGLAMKVISADGKDIEPTMAKKILMGMAETYDVVFTMPENKNYELRATAQDGTGYASTFIGSGVKVAAIDIPKPDLYATMEDSMPGMSHSMMHMEHETPSSDDDDMGDMDMSGMDMHEMNHSDMSSAIATPIEELIVDKLKSLTPTDLPKSAKVQELKLVLNGDMRRYVWYINGKTIAEDRLLTIKPGETVRIKYVNESMMHHPMHLHGHFFRVVNANGSYSPLKHTVDVPPMGSRTIEFYSDEVGQWMLHCHNLYHMETGMARVVRYENFVPSTEMSHFANHDHGMGDPWYRYSKAELSSNHAEGQFKLSQSWNEISLRAEGANIKGRNFDYSLRDQWDFEGDLFYRRWLDRWANVIVGATAYGERYHGVVGVGYFLPMMIETAILVNHEGQFRFDLERKFQWTKSLFSDVDFTWRPGNQNGDHPAEIEVSLMYAPRWAWAAGLMLTNDSLGAGIEYQF